MKKVLALTAICLFSFNLAQADDTADVNQRWLAAVEHKVQSGDMKISTASAERLTLLKAWAQKNGFALNVEQTPTRFYRIDVATSSVEQHAAL